MLSRSVTAPVIFRRPGCERLPRLRAAPRPRHGRGEERSRGPELQPRVTIHPSPPLGTADTAPLVADPTGSDADIASIFHALARGIASSPRQFDTLIPLDLDAMTFPRVLALVESFLAPRPGHAGGAGSGTGGAHEQFLVAALLQAVPDDAAWRCEWSPRA